MSKSGLMSQGNKVLDGPYMLIDTRFHRRSNPERLMDAPEVVPHIEEGNSVHVVLNLFGNSGLLVGSLCHP
jgi:hypothetical protein